MLSHRLGPLASRRFVHSFRSPRFRGCLDVIQAYLEPRHEPLHSLELLGRIRLSLQPSTSIVIPHITIPLELLTFQSEHGAS